jgi:peptide/nickel transport system substrate-binding protein
MPESFQPGVKAIRSGIEYWKTGRAHFDSVETIIINDVTARTSALISNQVDVMNTVDRKTVDLLKRSSAIDIKQSSGGQHYAMPMDCKSALLKDNNVRLALKYAADREEILKTVLRGYGRIGKTIRFRQQSLLQPGAGARSFDPDKAKFYLGKAGSSDLHIDLYASEAAFPGRSTPPPFINVRARAGIAINIKRAPSTAIGTMCG